MLLETTLVLINHVLKMFIFSTAPGPLKKFVDLGLVAF